jgi:hypothetical protein
VSLVLLGGAVGLAVSVYLRLTPPEPQAEEPAPPGESAIALPAEAAPTQVAPPVVERIPVNVNARPWARIEVDGVDVGVTPLAGLRLTPGSHRFRAAMPDGGVVERVEVITLDRRRVAFP